MSSDKLPDNANESEPEKPPECEGEGILQNGIDIDEDDNRIASDIGEIPPPSLPTDRRQSNLTIENLKLHEEVVAREDKSQQGSESPAKTTSQHSLPTTQTPLAPLKSPAHRIGSGGRVRPESGQRVEDGVVSPVPSRESLRPGSGKPLPPIGSDIATEVDAEKQHVFNDDNGQRASTPRILGYRREASNDNDNETMEPARAESLSKSERSVSFIESQENSIRLAGKTSKALKRNVPSPANREIVKSKNPDGTEKVSISIATETEWSWLESVRLASRLQGSDSITEVEAKETKSGTVSELSLKKRQRTSMSMSTTSRLSAARESGSEVEDLIGLHESDEKLDEESEYSDDDIGPLPSGTMIPRIGPPRIIQYQRESEQVIIQPKDPNKRTRHKHGMSIEGIEIPEEDEYVDNTDGTLASASSRQIRKRRSHARKAESHIGASGSSTSSDTQELPGGGSCEFCDEEIKPFPTTEMQQTMSAEEILVSGVCEFCHQDLKTFPTLEMHHTLDPDELYCCEEYQKLVEFTLESSEADVQVDEFIDVAPHAPFGSKQARRAAKERAAARLRDREMARQKAAGANQANFYALQVARQMKTINYALSSQRCMDEGWTLRAATPSDEEEEEPDPYEAQPVLQPPVMAMALKQKPKLDERNVISKMYANGQLFMVMFEDGTSTVFYQSGHAAIIVTSVEKGQYEYIVQEDSRSNGNLLALFEPNGKATCYQSNGQIKLNLTSHGGLYLDQKGGVKKRWVWKDPVTHTHSPPFQPICFAINKAISLRCMDQDQIFLQFNQEKQTIRFNVGAKLKLVKPENLPKDEVDEHLLYLSDIKAYFKVVTDKIHNAIKYSKSPKLDNLRPPYKVQKDLLRNQNLKAKKVQQQVVTGKGTPIVTVN